MKLNQPRLQNWMLDCKTQSQMTNELAVCSKSNSSILFKDTSSKVSSENVFISTLKSTGNLRINGNNLFGQLPIQMSGLNQLRTFRIDENDLTGGIPVLLCDAIDARGSTAYADCEEISCPCCSHCCTDAADPRCVCVVEDNVRCNND